jgi:Uma2 family endonuclease
MSTPVATQAPFTPEDLLAMPDSKSYELVGGQLVERKMGMKSGWVATRLSATLDQFCEKHGIGWAFNAENGYQCFPHDPGRVRRPDVSFVRYGRFPGGVIPEGWAKIRPDLLVEVLSTNETVEVLEDKLEDYKKVAVPLIWVIYPRSRKALVYRADGSSDHSREADELSGEDIIPGFRCPLASLFPPREPATEVQEKSTGPNGLE